MEEQNFDSKSYEVYNKLKKVLLELNTRISEENLFEFSKILSTSNKMNSKVIGLYEIFSF